MRRRPAWTAIIALGLLIAVALISVAGNDADASSDLRGSLLSTARLAVQMSCFAVAAIVGLSTLHYVAAAVAVRAAAGLRTPFGETVLVQLSASTANRLTPAALG